jgi:hypothetical protein
LARGRTTGEIDFDSLRLAGPGKIQKMIDRRFDPPHLAQGDLQVFGLVRRLGFLGNRLQEQLHGGQGGANLVGHAGRQAAQGRHVFAASGRSNGFLELGVGQSELFLGEPQSLAQFGVQAAQFASHLAKGRGQRANLIAPRGLGVGQGMLIFSPGEHHGRIAQPADRPDHVGRHGP